MAHSDRPGDDRERDWIRDERQRARGAFDYGDSRRVQRSYDYQAAERDEDERLRRGREARQDRGRDYGSRGSIPYGVTGPTNYDGGYGGDSDRQREYPGDVGRAYAGQYGDDYERFRTHDIPRGHYFGDTDRRGGDYVPNPREGRGEEVRTWWDRTSDELQAFFGDRDARRRRQWDEVRDASRPGEHRGVGPRGYRRSDDRIREDVSDRLTDDAWLDASYIDVEVKDGEVTLSGMVQRRGDKRRAEDLAESATGVGHVQNNLRVQQADSRTPPTGDRNTLETGGTAATQATTTSSGRA